MPYFLQGLPYFGRTGTFGVGRGGPGLDVSAAGTNTAAVRGRQSRSWRGGGRRSDIGLESMPRAVDRESLLVQEIADAPDQKNFVVLVVASIAPTLDRLELSELLLPIAEHVRLDRTKITNLADGEVPLGGDRWKFGLNSAVVRHGSQLRPWPSASGLRGR